MKELFEWQPADWLRFLGCETPQAVTTVDADISTFTMAADKVFDVQDSTGSWIQHLEPQASRLADLDERTHVQNALLRYRHRRRIVSTVLMLRPEADSPGIAGRVYDEPPDGRNALLFCYQIIRVWQCPVEAVLGGGLAALPLAPLSDRKGHSLRQVIDRIQERLDQHATPEDAKHVWAATYILMGLSFSVEEATEVLAGAQAMRESATYQAILQEGRKTGLEEGVVQGRQEGMAQGRQEGLQAGIRDGRRQEAVHFLLRLASRRLGPPAQEVLTRLQAIDSVEAIEAMGERLLEVESWDELLS